jgi:2-polyprenyl-3-methyl-5-hydroxy-6-metoxy-1,4-benzoquinol methylase
MDPGRGYIYARHIQQFAVLRFDIIACLEVLEHLRDHDMDCFVSFCHRNLNANGKIVISVPIMIRPIIILKALNAKYINRSPWSYSVRELFKSGVMLRIVDRDQDDKLYLNHKGFDFRILRYRLMKEFRIVNEFNSPLPWLWWGFNSQWFAVLERKSLR